MAVGAAIASLVAPVTAVCVAEPVPDRSRSVVTRNVLRDLGNSRTVWVVTGFLLVCNIPQSFGTPLYFYQKNTLALSDVTIGYLTATAGAGGLLASILYGFLCQKLSMLGLLVLGTISPSVGILAFLFYVSVPAALVVELLGGFSFGMGTLALMQVSVISTLTPSAAFGFAVFMSVSNAGAAIGDNLAAILVDRFTMTLFDVIKVFAVTSAACCVLVFFLPRGLLARLDGSRGSSEPDCE